MSDLLSDWRFLVFVGTALINTGIMIATVWHNQKSIARVEEASNNSMDRMEAASQKSDERLREDVRGWVDDLKHQVEKLSAKVSNGLSQKVSRLFEMLGAMQAVCEERSKRYRVADKHSGRREDD